MKNKWLSVFFLLLVLLLFLFSCNRFLPYTNHPPTPTITKSVIINIGDGGFITNEPCGPPCFWGITPSVSNYDETINQLNSKGVNTSDCEYSLRHNPDQNELHCGPLNPGYAIGITFDLNNIVMNLGFTPEPPINLKNVIEKYGSPDHIDVANLSVSEEPPNIGVQIFYDRFQAILILPYQKGKGNIYPAITIEGISYISKDSYAERVLHSQLWHGYGEYETNP